MDQVLGDFSNWLSATPFSLLLQTHEWIIPTVQSLHIMAVTIVMGAAIMVDMKLLGVVGRGSPISATTRRFLPWVWVALVVLLFSGSILTIAEPRRELLNNAFRLKMILIVTIVAVTIVFQEAVRRNADAWGDEPSNKLSARMLAIASLAIWISIVACGRWIAYVEHG